MPKKSPYLGYSEDQIKVMESQLFTLNLGGDFVNEEGHHLFTKKEASRLHKKIMKNLIEIVRDRNAEERDRRYASDLLAFLSIRSLRLH